MPDLQLPQPPESWNKIHGAASANIIQYCKLHTLKKLDGNIYHGTISYYYKGFVGKLTATGEIYTGRDLTAASPLEDDGHTPVIPLGTILIVQHSDKQVRVRVNDTGSFGTKYGRILDLSPEAFRQLADLKTGVIDATIQEV